STYERFGPFVEVRAAEDLLFSRRLVLAGGRILFTPAMRVFHDNRRRVRPFLRNQVVLGTYTAMARRVVPFEDSSSRLLFLALLPVAPAAKIAKIAWRLARGGPGSYWPWRVPSPWCSSGRSPTGSDRSAAPSRASNYGATAAPAVASAGQRTRDDAARRAGQRSRAPPP